MRLCHQCDAAVADDARFCGQCGESCDLRLCPACGSANPLDNRFCDQCGLGFESALIDTGAPVVRQTLVAPLAERKLATVVFADVVGYTTLAEHADPEVVARTIDSALRRMTDVVHRYGGTVDKYLGDGLMAVFGVPNAHDDDAERAIAAALELVGLFDFAADLTLSIGVNTGEVMAMAIGEDSRLTVIGDVVNVAARLEKVAGPGQVLAGPLTADLAGRRVLFRRRDPVIVKGKSDEVDVWEAIALRTESVRTTDQAFVGRAETLDFLQTHYAHCVDQQRGSILAITGAGGIGKSRLITEFFAQSQRAEPPPRVVNVNYPPYGAATSAAVYGQLLEALGATGDVAIDTRVRLLAGDVEASMRTLDPRSLEREGYWGLRQFLKFHSLTQPLVVCVDDLHRSDRSFRIMFGDVAVQLNDSPVLVLGVGRDTQVSWLEGLEQEEVITLGPLTQAESLEYVNQVESEHPLSSSTAKAIVERANGNPLYLRELLRYQLSAREDGHDLSVDDRLLPASLKGVLSARLDAMDPADKVCVQHVSILGDNATADRIAALGPLSFDASLVRLVQSGVLVRDAVGRYSVADALLAEVAYETLPHNVRGLRHKTAALLATTQLERAEQFDLAMLYLEDDALLRAENAQAHALAGSEALSRASLVEGIHLLVRAVELGYTQPLELLELARVLVDLGRTTEARRVLQSVVFDNTDPRTTALMLRRDYLFAMTYPDQQSVAASVELQRIAQAYLDLDDQASYGESLLSLAQLLARIGDNDQALLVADRAYEALLMSDDIRRVLVARRTRAQLRPDQHDLLDELLRDLPTVEELNDRSLLVEWLSAIVQEEFINSYDAYPDQTQVLEATLIRQIALTSELALVEHQITACCLLAGLYRFQGRASEAVRYIEMALELGDVESTEHAHLRECADFVVRLVFDPTYEFNPQPMIGRSPLAIAGNLMVQSALLLHGRADVARRSISVVLQGHTGVGRSWIRYRLNYARALADLHLQSEAKSIAHECVNLATRHRSQSMRACAHALWVEVSATSEETSSAVDKVAQPRYVACLEELAVVRALRSRSSSEPELAELDQLAEDTLAGLAADLVLLSGL